jgi:DNA/RNA-binding domain of Phe-tRNA-synthetase-like protein
MTARVSNVVHSEANFFVTRSARDAGIKHPVVAIFRNVNPGADAKVYDADIAKITSADSIRAIKEYATTTAEVIGYRKLYERLGYPGLKTAGERILEGAEKKFNRYGALVDAYNLVALRNVEGLGCHDISNLPKDMTLIFRRAHGDEKMTPSFKKKEETLKKGDLTYGIYDAAGVFQPFAWLGKRDVDNSKYQLGDHTNAVLLTAIGHADTSREYNIRVCKDVFENILKSSPDATMELLVGQFIDDIPPAGVSAGSLDYAKAL